MATVRITLARSASRANTGGTLPLGLAAIDSAQDMTSSGASQATTIAASQPVYQHWEIEVDGGDVWMAAGVSPVAVVGSGRLIRDGVPREFGVAETGEKLAVIDA